MPKGRHILWKENKFPTPPISVRLEVKYVSLKVATYQHFEKMLFVYFTNYLKNAVFI